MTGVAVFHRPVSARLLAIALVLIFCVGMLPIMAHASSGSNHTTGLQLDGKGLLIALAAPTPAPTPSMQLVSSTLVGIGSSITSGTSITLGADNNQGGGIGCPVFGGLGCNTLGQNVINALDCLNPILAIASIFTLGSWGCAKFILDAIKQIGSWVLSEVLMEIIHTMNIAMVASVVSLTKFVMVDLLGDNTAGPVSLTPQLNCNANVAGSDCRSVSWFTAQLAEMRLIGTWLLLPMLLLVVLQAIIRGSLFFLLRAVLVMLPIAVLGTLAVTTFAQLMISIANDMSSFLAHRTVDPATFGAAFSQSLQKLDKGTFGLYTLFWLIALIIALVIIVIELLLREMSIYLVMLFFPIGFAALVYPPLTRLFKRSVTLTLSLIFMQPFITMVVCAGFAAMASAQESAATTIGAGPANGAHSILLHAPDPNAISNASTLHAGAAGDPPAAGATIADTPALVAAKAAVAANPNDPKAQSDLAAAKAAQDNLDPDLDIIIHQVILACIIFLTGGFGGFKFLAFTPAGEAIENRIAHTGNVLGMGDYTAQRLSDYGQKFGDKVNKASPGAGDTPQAPGRGGNPPGGQSPSRPPGRSGAAPGPPSRSGGRSGSRSTASRGGR